MKSHTFEARELEEVEALSSEMKERGFGSARLALVLGSGLGPFVRALSGAEAIPFASLAGLPKSSVPGHAGRFVIGELDGIPVVVQEGRVHLYEGWSAYEVTRAVRALARVGLPGLLLTNAAGGLEAAWEPGSLMRIEDHVNRQSCTPLFASERARGCPYDPDYGNALDRAAAEAGVALRRGVYVGLSGPSYETPAEIRMLRWMGIQAVGMSTVAEASAAHAAGMRVAAISCITNHAAGIAPGVLAHEDVLAVGREAAGRMIELLRKAVPGLCA